MVDAFLASGQNYFDTAWTYMDGENDSVQSRKCLEVAEEFGKKVIVMEPVKGGMLANVPEEASEIRRRTRTAATAFPAAHSGCGSPNILNCTTNMRQSPTTNGRCSPSIKR